jgi:hypothetical protein
MASKLVVRHLGVNASPDGVSARADRQAGYSRSRTRTGVGIVESVTGRKVRAFLSQNHIDPAIAVEMFVLEPEGGDEASDVETNKA